VVSQTMKSRMVGAARWLSGLVLAASLGACSYSLQGRAVHGDYSAVELVDASDPRLNDPKSAVPGVSVHVQADPTKLNRKTLGRVVSGRSGEFSMPVDEFGAGMLEYNIGVFARKKGYEPAEGFFGLPGSGKRLLITLAPGVDKDTNEMPSSLKDEFDLNRMR